jgi:hypothetical protein
MGPIMPLKATPRLVWKMEAKRSAGEVHIHKVSAVTNFLSGTCSLDVTSAIERDDVMNTYERNDDSYIREWTLAELPSLHRH